MDEAQVRSGIQLNYEDKEHGVLLELTGQSSEHTLLLSARSKDAETSVALERRAFLRFAYAVSSQLRHDDLRAGISGVYRVSALSGTVELRYDVLKFDAPTGDAPTGERCPNPPGVIDAEFDGDREQVQVELLLPAAEPGFQPRKFVLASGPFARALSFAADVVESLPHDPTEFDDRPYRRRR